MIGLMVWKFLVFLVFSRLFVIFQFLLPQKLLSVCAGRFAASKISKKIIPWFIKTYGVNMTEALKPDPNTYHCFNDFFIRHINPKFRPINNEALMISPVDGIASQVGQINEGSLIQAKGIQYTLSALLAEQTELIKNYTFAQFATLYLSPKDYHRVHAPMDVTLKQMIYVPGALFSVNTQTTQYKSDLFTKNERLIIEFSTDHGPLCLILVGAMIVGTIATIWHGDIKRHGRITRWDYAKQSLTYKKGEEIGHFKLGSTVILLTNAKNNRFNIGHHDALKLGESIMSE